MCNPYCISCIYMCLVKGGLENYFQDLGGILIFHLLILGVSVLL